MPVFDLAPVSLRPDEVVRALCLDRRAGGEETAGALLAEAVPLLHPRAVCREAFIESRTADTTTIEDRVFRSRVLRVNLEKAFKCFPFVLTVGPELEDAAARTDDLLHRYDLETLADLALEAARTGFRDRLAAENGFALLASMSPGSLEDWPLEEQIPLFALLGNAPAEIGVRLTDALLMLPRKSVSGVFFPSAETFFSCRLCSRKSCPGRKAPFDPSTWDRYRSDKP